MPGGEIDRRYYEFCVLSELCDRLRAGDVWVVGSRRYRSFEEHLISHEVLQELLQGATLPVAVDPDFERFIAGRHALLDARLAAVDAKAKGGLLPEVSLEKGVLKIAPIENRRRRRPRHLPPVSTRCCRASASPTCCPRWRAGRRSPIASLICAAVKRLPIRAS